MKLRQQLVILMTLFAVVLIAASFVPLWFSTQEAHFETFLAQRIREGEAVAVSLRDKPAAIQERIVHNRYPIAGSTAGWLLGADGTTSSIVTDRSKFVSSANAPEIGRAMRGGVAYEIRRVGGEERLFLAVRVIERSRTAHVLWLSNSQRQVRELDRSTLVALIATGFAVMIAAIVLARIGARHLTRGLERLAEGADRFGEGNLDFPLIASGSREVTDLAGRLNVMAARIRALLEQRENLVAAAAHQIRTPMTVMRLRIDEVRASDEPLEADVAEALTDVEQEIERLVKLTSRLLELSAADTAGPLDQLDVAQVVADAASRLEPLAQKRHMRITTSAEPIEVLAPPGTLDEVVFNLLDNALRHSAPGTEVEIRATSGEYARVEILDRGPGIPAEVRDRLFQPFAAGPRSNRGHGLGLAICARICSAAGARLSLDDRFGGGTIAVVEWPLAADAVSA